MAFAVPMGVLLATSAMSRQPSVPKLSAITRGGSGPPTLVLLHGYGSSEKDWIPFAKTILLPHGARFLFPRGPEVAKRTDGAPAGRAWWHLDLAGDSGDQGLGADLSLQKPAGIEHAAQAVRAFLARQGNRAAQPVILGGFSQGAMVAAQIAFRSDEPLRALVLLSGTLVDEPSWKANFARRKGLHVFIAHGRLDRTLSFEAADRMRGEMAAAGVEVTWFPFDGGHETPTIVVAALNDFLSHL
jgi:phospholipase/carboxylesterase